jgi:hypothetical protein
MKQFLRSCQSNNKRGLYGAPYVVEADQFASIKISRCWNNFGTFINAMNQTFVEPIDNVNGKKFFHNEMKSLFPYLYEALNRIRLLRHNADHLRLREHVEAELTGMLETDLFGSRLTALKEPWFLLQQICLDETFAAIQYERASLESSPTNCGG